MSVDVKICDKMKSLDPGKRSHGEVFQLKMCRQPFGIPGT